MSDFDPAKSLREELQSLADVEGAVRRRERACEAAISEAEVELNAIRKLRGYVRLQIETARHRLTKLEQER